MEDIVPVRSSTRNVSNSDGDLTVPAPRILKNLEIEYPPNYDFETMLIFCAQNKEEASKQCKQNFSKANFLRQKSLVSQSPNHFAFQIEFTRKDLTLLERDAKKLN